MVRGVLDDDGVCRRIHLLFRGGPARSHLPTVATTDFSARLFVVPVSGIQCDGRWILSSTDPNNRTRIDCRSAGWPSCLVPVLLVFRSVPTAHGFSRTGGVGASGGGCDGSGGKPHSHCIWHVLLPYATKDC